MSDVRPNFRLIKSQVSMLDVLARYKVELRARNQYRRDGRCPLPQHGNREGKPSFHVDLVRNVWVWACHEPACKEARGGKKKGGDLIEFVAFMEKCTLRQAGECLDSWYGPFNAGIPGMPAPQEAPVPAPAPRKVNLPLGFELQGVRHVHPYLAVRGFEEEECEYLGVGFFPGKGVMRNRIVFPLHDAEGRLIGYAGRRVEYSLLDDDDSPVAPDCPNLERWLFPAGFLRGQVLYNMHRVTEDDWTEVVVVESFWGVLACVRAGIMNAVAVMSNYATPDQVRQLAGFRKVTVLFDGDQPGRQGARDLVEKLTTAGVEEIELKMLREGIQPDGVSPDTLRACIGIPKEPDGPLTITGEALSLLEAAPAS